MVFALCCRITWEFSKQIPRVRAKKLTGGPVEPGNRPGALVQKARPNEPATGSRGGTQRTKRKVKKEVYFLFAIFVFFRGYVPPGESMSSSFLLGIPPACRLQYAPPLNIIRQF
jgi:hypothetical protein